MTRSGTGGSQHRRPGDLAESNHSGVTKDRGIFPDSRPPVRPGIGPGNRSVHQQEIILDDFR